MLIGFGPFKKGGKILCRGFWAILKVGKDIMEDGPTVLGSLWKERNNGRERDNLNLPSMRWLKFNVDGSMQGKPYVCVCGVCQCGHFNARETKADQDRRDV